MILQALNEYYERMLNAQDSGMPHLGTSIEGISFALVLDCEGNLKDIEDLREEGGKKLVPRKIPVPAAETRTSGIKANFIWDKAVYVLGADEKGSTSQNKERLKAFQQKLKEVGGDLSDEGFKAILKFYEHWDSDSAEIVAEGFQDWEDLCKANLVFRLQGIPGFIHERPAIQERWLKFKQSTADVPLIQCLISGKKDSPQARVHTPIKGIRGSQTSGGYIVSYNASAFVSYKKDKAAVSEKSAFAYTTALNSLLSNNSRQKIQIGDTTMVFWAECPNDAEEFFADLFYPPIESENETATSDDQETAGKIRGLLKAIRDGKKPTDILPELDDSVQFYILGLSPNAARISVRFWEANNLGTLLKRIGKHYEHLAIAKQYDRDPEFPSLWQLLRQTAALGKSENISPVLAGGIARSILKGVFYPESLLSIVLGRIRAEHSVTYFRAALLKAFLIRNRKREVSVKMDPDRTDLPYLLGRLFAVLEKAQEEAIPGTNATIKDRYLGSAASTPAQVFNMLLKNSANHLSKLRKTQEKKGVAVHYDKIIQDIISKFSDFPTTQSAEEQGLFMIGYYHQRKDFYTKKTQEV